MKVKVDIEGVDVYIATLPLRYEVVAVGTSASSARSAALAKGWDLLENDGYWQGKSWKDFYQEWNESIRVTKCAIGRGVLECNN